MGFEVFGHSRTGMVHDARSTALTEEPPALRGGTVLAAHMSERGPIDLASIYEAQVGFVWRSLRRRGVPAHRLDDAVQNVFLVVHRRLHEFERRSSLKTWLFGIVQRVAHDDHRTRRRMEAATGKNPEHDPDAFADPRAPDPSSSAEQSDAIRRLELLLAGLSPEKREVFLLTELEQMTAPEIAEALGIPLGRVYSRLRAARTEFERALAAQRSAQPATAGTAGRDPSTDGGGEHGAE